MNSKTLFRDFINRITLSESLDEIQSVAYLVFENLFGLTKGRIMSETDVSLTAAIENKLNEIVSRINRSEPIQYVLGESFFYGRIFNVNPGVLIPRPETEELIHLVINFVRGLDKKRTRIIDIGTGSGCIAITLALELRDTEVFGTDISSEALVTATANAERLNAKTQFVKHDVLKSKLPFSIDIIVSNPPYIGWDEHSTMSKNVVEYEPKLALFVDSDDPLLFYKAIVTRATESLTAHGLLAVEINERFGQEVKQLFVANQFYDVEIVKDIFGKDRIVKGVLSS
ncbi:MAG TPA: peptide chain release factor N(5)-glutamine methyltransferase [Chryseolinea sp.]|nr:peptide chain release factor N(5)-glutamine methyltransferase [Chryseolinea sp.]